MALTDIATRNTRPAEKDQKLFDDKGMRLFSWTDLRR
jgi:hypothetical protein